MNQIHTLSHAEAMAIVAAARERAEKAGKAVCVAVADPHGELLAFLRMDGCQLPSIDIAQNKAYTAARERTPSGEIGARMRASGQPMTNYGDLRYVAWSGGLPVVHDGMVVGAIGVSGLTEKEDVELAAAAIAAVKL